MFFLLLFRPLPGSTLFPYTTLFRSWIAFIPALLIGFFQDPSLVIWVSLVTLIAQQTDANLITPNIMGKTLKIHPLTIITVLLAAGKIAGFMGILLGVPAYAVGKRSEER